MATNPATKEIYPFSTRDGEPIPLDVIGGSGLLIKNIAGSGVTDFTIPSSFVVGSLYCELGCILQFGQTMPNPPVDNTEYPDTLFIPKDSIIVAALISGPARLIPIGTVATKLYMQSIKKWAALALNQQVRIK